jgi:hypothetical protein
VRGENYKMIFLVTRPEKKEKRRNTNSNFDEATEIKVQEISKNLFSSFISV